jgi:hypothetical protein
MFKNDELMTWNFDVLLFVLILLFCSLTSISSFHEFSSYFTYFSKAEIKKIKKIVDEIKSFHFISPLLPFHYCSKKCLEKLKSGVGVGVRVWVRVKIFEWRVRVRVRVGVWKIEEWSRSEEWVWKKFGSEFTPRECFSVLIAPLLQHWYVVVHELTESLKVRSFWVRYGY